MYQQFKNFGHYLHQKVDDLSSYQDFEKSKTSDWDRAEIICCRSFASFTRRRVAPRLFILPTPPARGWKYKLGLFDFLAFKFGPKINITAKNQIWVKFAL